MQKTRKRKVLLRLHSYSDFSLKIIALIFPDGRLPCRFEKLKIPSLKQPIEEKHAQMMLHFGKEIEQIAKVVRYS